VCVCGCVCQCVVVVLAVVPPMRQLNVWLKERYKYLEYDAVESSIHMSIDIDIYIGSIEPINAL